MNKPLLPAFLLWSVLFFSFQPEGAFAQAARGGDDNPVLVIVIEGAVEVAPAGTDNWAAAKLNQQLQPGDKIRTGKLSRAVLRSKASGELPVRESSLLTINAPNDVHE